MKYTTDQKLKILVSWLQEADEMIPYTEGKLEESIRIAKNEVKREIGDYLEEILNGSDEFLKNELNKQL